VWLRTCGLSHLKKQNCVVMHMRLITSEEAAGMRNPNVLNIISKPNIPFDPWTDKCGKNGNTRQGLYFK
jgi:hypothetical protein